MKKKKDARMEKKRGMEWESKEKKTDDNKERITVRMQRDWNRERNKYLNIKDMRKKEKKD